MSVIERAAWKTATQRLVIKVNEIIDHLNANEVGETVFDDYTVSSLGLGTAQHAPTPKTFVGGLEAGAFAGTGLFEEGFFTIHLLHGLKQGSSPTFHVHWSHITPGGTGDVKWNVEYSLARGYGVGAYSGTTTLSVVQSVADPFVHMITDDDEMVVTNSVEVEPDAVVIGRLFRDPADVEDTFAGDAYFLQVDMHYERSHIGTTERNREWTSTGY